MTRTGDAALPVVDPHPIGPDSPLYAWPWRPTIALEQLPQPAYTWDDTDPDLVWDQAEALGYVWDAPFIGSGFRDVVCDFHVLDIDPGDVDELYLFAPTTVTLTLDNRAGAYTVWSADGRLVYWAPGRRIAVWVYNVDTGERLWLFAGRVAAWVANPDETVTITAYDGFSWLAQELGGDWTPGVAGQRPLQRLIAIAAAAAYPDPLRGDTGDNTLTTGPVGSSPLEEAERVALSDGGLFYGDADGSLVYRNRLWRAGRADQPRLWVISDNVCAVPVVVWDPELAADDDRLATDVRLINVAGLVATATLPAGSPWALDARYRLTHPDPDLWTTQTEGNTLAAYLLAEQSTPSMALSAARLYVQDPTQAPDVWDYAVGIRRGDLLEVLHDFIDSDGNPAQLDVYAIALGVGHQITPEQWVTSLALSRTVDWRQVERWDRTRFHWDEVNIANVWRY